MQRATPIPTQPASPPPAPSPDPFGSAAAIFSIVLALAAAVLGYRIIRGGRGL